MENFLILFIRSGKLIECLSNILADILVLLGLARRFSTVTKNVTKFDKRKRRFK